jgi:hypothetical protein
MDYDYSTVKSVINSKERDVTLKYSKTFRQVLKLAFIAIFQYIETVL